MIPLVLLPVRNERMGGSGGPSYATRAGNAASTRARRFLEQYFTIVDKPVTDTGWQLGGDTILKI